MMVNANAKFINIEKHRRLFAVFRMGYIILFKFYNLFIE